MNRNCNADIEPIPEIANVRKIPLSSSHNLAETLETDTLKSTVTMMSWSC